MAPTDRITKLLVLWYGLYQLGHVLANLRGLTLIRRGRPLDFPAPPPPEGWSEQTLHLWFGLAATDLFGALLALIFVVGFLRRSRWWLTLGPVVLTISLYAAVVFNYGTWRAGAWTAENLWIYVLVNILFLPVVGLAVLVYRWNFAAAVCFAGRAYPGAAGDGGPGILPRSF